VLDPEHILCWICGIKADCDYHAIGVADLAVIKDSVDGVSGQLRHENGGEWCSS
jgi:hypothetical protein